MQWERASSRKSSHRFRLSRPGTYDAICRRFAPPHIRRRRFTLRRKNDAAESGRYVAGRFLHNMTVPIFHIRR